MQFSLPAARLRQAPLLFLALIPVVLGLWAESARAARPNVVLIQTDDQSLNTLRSTFRGPDNKIRRTMPNLLRLVASQGTEFVRYYASQPVCGPSRAALLTGQYAHTSGLRANTGPNGGWTGWQRLPLYNENLATRLQSAGYRTVHIGKFTNAYMESMDEDGRITPETTVPPGWSGWHTMSYFQPPLFYGYYLNRNGVVGDLIGSPGYDWLRNGVDPPRCTAALLVAPAWDPACQHATDVYSRIAVEQIRAAGDQPFYLQVDYNSPHGDARPPNGPEPTSRHYDTAHGTRAPRVTGFDEAAIGDKPAWLRQIAPRLTANEKRRIDTRWQKDLESLRDVDDGVGAIIKTLRQTGKLDNTYVVFLADNGLFHGQHRLETAKYLAYEPSARVPMMIRGPGVPRGRRAQEVVANIDVAPTVLDLAGVAGRNRMDGRSLRPFWNSPQRRTRRPVLIESYLGGGAQGKAAIEAAGLVPKRRPNGGLAGISVAAPALSYQAVRLGAWKYVEYANGDRELYNLIRDPHELQNRVDRPNVRQVQRRLRFILRERQQCRAAACRKVVGPLPAGTAGNSARG